jgi:hypothetical protein
MMELYEIGKSVGRIAQLERQCSQKKSCIVESKNGGSRALSIQVLFWNPVYGHFGAAQFS